MKTLLKVFQTLVIALVISVTLLGSPWMASPAAALECNEETPLRENGFVHRVNVKNLDYAMEFYGEKLGLPCNAEFFTPQYWAEFNSADDSTTSIGLSANPYEAFEPRTVGTLVVDDMAYACETLKSNGIAILGNEYAAVNENHGVCLAFFKDWDGNDLAYRQEVLDSDLNPMTETECNTIINNKCQVGLDND